MVNENDSIINSWFIAYIEIFLIHCLYWNIPDSLLILKCILFTFRRDTHEIFAEPVDPNEVCICLLVPLILYTDAAISTILFNILMEMCVLIRLKITMKSLKSLWILALWGLNFMRECIEVLNNLRFACFFKITSLNWIGRHSSFFTIHQLVTSLIVGL